MRALFPAPRRRKDGEALGDALGRERDTLLLIERLDLIAANDDVTTKRARRALKRRAHRLAARADRIGARLHRAGA